MLSSGRGREQGSAAGSDREGPGVTPEVALDMRQLLRGVTLVLLALSAASCYDFQKDAPVSPSALPAGRFASVKVEYRQPPGCANTGTACDNLVVFFGSWMKPGEEVYLSDAGGHVWSGVVSHVPVNWPPSDQPHLVRVFDPHLVDTPNAGITAARLLIGGQAIYFFDSPGTPQESGLIYIDDNGVGRNPS
jgi:hypothetical protein